MSIEEMIETYVPPVPAERTPGAVDWKIIQKFDGGVKIFPPYSEEDAAMCQRVFFGGRDNAHSY